MTTPKGTHGGRRKGAGRPRNAPRLLPTMLTTQCPLEWLLALMAHTGAPLSLRVAAARAVLPYQHNRAGG